MPVDDTVVTDATIVGQGERRSSARRVDQARRRQVVPRGDAVERDRHEHHRRSLDGGRPLFLPARCRPPSTSSAIATRKEDALPGAQRRRAAGVRPISLGRTDRPLGAGGGRHARQSCRWARRATITFADVFRVLPLGVSSVDGSVGYPLIARDARLVERQGGARGVGLPVLQLARHGELLHGARWRALRVRHQPPDLLDGEEPESTRPTGASPRSSWPATTASPTCSIMSRSTWRRAGSSSRR